MQQPPTLRFCVYCGSGLGNDPAFGTAARALGRTMAEAGIGLVYGGGGRGLMGEVAHAVMQHGGHVTGIIPDFLAGHEHALHDIQDLRIVATMHERKQAMFDLSDAFIALPGGIGTLEEFVEQLTWNQIGQHRKPLLLANVLDYWAPLMRLFDHMQEAAFIRPEIAIDYIHTCDISQVIPLLIAALNPVPSRHLPVADSKLDTVPSARS